MRMLIAPVHVFTQVKYLAAIWMKNKRELQLNSYNHAMQQATGEVVSEWLPSHVRVDGPDLPPQGKVENYSRRDPLDACLSYTSCLSRRLDRAEALADEVKISAWCMEYQLHFSSNLKKN